jgi:Zn-dependent peptidase ImmA (M78 family)
MVLESETLDKARNLLRDGLERAGGPLLEDGIEALALKIAFAISVKPTFESRIGKAVSRGERPLSLKLASSMASQLRDELRVGGVEPLFELPSLLGEKLKIGILPLEQENVVGGCISMGNAAFIFLPQTRRVADLFICAHELGHLLLISRRKNSEGAAFDLSSNCVSSVRSPHEYFADAFARELLVPTKGLGIALQETRRHLNVSGNAIGDIELLYLSRIFGVSFLVIAKRCEQAALLPEGGAVALYRFLVKEFGGPEKRADMIQLPPRREVEIPAVPYSIQVATIKRIKNDVVATQQTPSVGSPEEPLTRKLARGAR